MVLVFARGLSDGLVGLIKQIDAVVAADSKKQARGFVAFVNDADGAFRKRLVETAEREKITMPLTISKERPPKGYALAEDAYVTALVYDDLKVKESFALRESELDEAAIGRIVDAAKRLQGAGEGPAKYGASGDGGRREF